MSLKAIFFDAAGTLIKSARPVGESYALLAKNYGMEVLPAEVGARFRACFSSAPPLVFPGTEFKEIPARERQWWKELVKKTFEPYGDFARFDDYFSHLFSYFSKADAWSLYPETEETLVALKERGFILDVVSNFDSRLFGILDGLGLGNRFDSVVLSSRVGHAKPEAGIFQAALSLHNLKAEEALHIGDSVDKDAEGAAGAGLMGVLLDRNGRVTVGSFPRVQNLKEILALIDRHSR